MEPIDPSKPITIDLVHQAANEIDHEGKKPKYQAVRERLGKGSYTTISQGLATWKPPAQSAPDCGPIPPEVAERATALAKGLWSTAYTIARKEANRSLDEIAREQQESEARCMKLAELADEQAEQIDKLNAQLAEQQGEIEKHRKRAENLALELCASQAQARTLESQMERLLASIKEGAKLNHDEPEHLVTDAVPIDPA